MSKSSGKMIFPDDLSDAHGILTELHFHCYAERNFSELYAQTIAGEKESKELKEIKEIKEIKESKEIKELGL